MHNRPSASVIFYTVILSLPLWIASCLGKYSSDSQRVIAVNQDTETIVSDADTIWINPDDSSIHWKGTKMRGAGKHEGVLQIKSGYFLKVGDKIKGGEFIADMSTIRVTDIPEHEPVPQKNLNNHLKSEDFFDAEKYPVSIFTMTAIENLHKDSVIVSGNLTVRNISKNISLNALLNDTEFAAEFSFDRFDWNIAYRGSWADRTLVDRDVEIKVSIIIPNRSNDSSFEKLYGIRDSIQGALNKGIKATRNKDIDLYMSLMPEDLLIYDESGEVISRKKQREYALRDWSIIDTTLRIEMRVDSLSYLGPGRVLAYTCQEWERIMFRRDGITKDTVLTTQRHKESWRKTPKGWFGYEIKELGGQIWLNGERYNPGG